MGPALPCSCFLPAASAQGPWQTSPPPRGLCVAGAAGCPAALRRASLAQLLVCGHQNHGWSLPLCTADKWALGARLGKSKPPAPSIGTQAPLRELLAAGRGLRPLRLQWPVLSFPGFTVRVGEESCPSPHTAHSVSRGDAEPSCGAVLKSRTFWTRVVSALCHGHRGLPAPEPLRPTQWRAEEPLR